MYGAEVSHLVEREKKLHVTTGYGVVLPRHPPIAWEKE